MAAGAALFLAVYGVLLRLTAPAIALEDSGEFATAASTLTLTHPPGYPLYLLAGRLAAALPVGSPGFRLGMLSAAALAAAGVLNFALLRAWTRAPRAAALAAAAVLVFAPAAVAQGTIPDKYALNLAILGVLQWTALRAWREGGRWPAFLALAGGLALSHHLQALYLAPAAAALLMRGRRGRWGRPLALLAALGLLGLSLKPVALPLVSRATVSLMFGPLDSFASLRRYLGARDYAGRFKAFTVRERAARLADPGLAGLARQAGWPALALAAGGAVWAARVSPAPAAAAGAGAVLALLLVASFDIGGVDYYLLPVVGWIGLFCGAGLAALARGPGRRIVPLLSGAVVLLAAARGWPAAAGSSYYGGLDRGFDLLAAMRPGAVLVTLHDDDFYPPMYVQRVLGRRTDVVIVHRPFLTRLWHLRQVERLHPAVSLLDPELIPWGRTLQPEEFVNLFVRSHFGRRPLAFSYLARGELAGGFSVRPDGPAFAVGRRRLDPAPPTAEALARRLRRFRLRSAFTAYPEGSRFAEVAGVPATAFTKLAIAHLDRGNPAEARRALRRARRFPHTRVVPEDVAKIEAAAGI